MIDADRKHGPFDPRFDGRAPQPDPRRAALLNRTARTDGRVQDVVTPRRAQSMKLEPLATTTLADRSELQRWETDGGRPGAASERGMLWRDAPGRLESYAFRALCFPGRRAHDSEAVGAYADYRSRRVR